MPNCPKCGEPMNIGTVCVPTIYGLMRCKPTDKGARHVSCQDLPKRRGPWRLSA